MKFVHHDLGQCKGKEVVEVSLSGNAANVRLMDSSNLSNYRNGRRHSYIGGLAKKSLVRLQIPRSGYWHVAVDLQGFGRANVKSSARVLPSPLPDIQEAPLSSIPGLVQCNFTDNFATTEIIILPFKASKFLHFRFQRRFTTPWIESYFCQKFKIEL